MNRVLFFFCCLFICLGANGQSILDLEGKEIIIPNLLSERFSLNYTNSVYTEEGVKSKKFTQKNTYNKNIWGERIHVLSVESLNKGKKDEAILISATHEGKLMGIYIPFRYSIDETPYSSIWFTNVIQEPKLAHVYETGRLRNLKIPYIDAALVDSLCSVYRNKIIYPIASGYFIPDNRKDYEIHKRFPDDYILLGKPYVFTDICLDKKDFYRRSLSLSVHLKDMSGRILKFPLRCSTLEIPNNEMVMSDARLKPCPSIESFSDFFYTEEELMIASINRLNQDSISLLAEKWEGQDIFVNATGKDTYATYSNEPTVRLSLDNKFLSYGAVPKGYYTVEKISLMPSDANRPYMLYYAILKGEEDKIAIPLVNGFDNNMMLSAEKRALDEKKSLEEAARIKEQEELLAKEEREEHNRLVKKFGASNARLIENGEIRLGFSKAMVTESWGSPADVMTVTNRLGSVDCWIYGIASYVYFKSGRVVQIIN